MFSLSLLRLRCLRDQLLITAFILSRPHFSPFRFRRRPWRTDGLVIELARLCKFATLTLEGLRLSRKGLRVGGVEGFCKLELLESCQHYIAASECRNWLHIPRLCTPYFFVWLSRDYAMEGGRDTWSCSATTVDSSSFCKLVYWDSDAAAAVFPRVIIS